MGGEKTRRVFQRYGDLKVGREHGDGVERSCAGGEEGTVIVDCTAVAIHSGWLRTRAYASV
jgi:hypothetical protein